MSRWLNRTCPTRIVTSSTETTVPPSGCDSTCATRKSEQRSVAGRYPSRSGLYPRGRRTAEKHFSRQDWDNAISVAMLTCRELSNGSSENAGSARRFAGRPAVHRRPSDSHRRTLVRLGGPSAGAPLLVKLPINLVQTPDKAKRLRPSRFREDFEDLKNLPREGDCIRDEIPAAVLKCPAIPLGFPFNGNCAPAPPPSPRPPAAGGCAPPSPKSCCPGFVIHRR